jgi:beta-N-acetylhexosaminidase
VDTTLETLRDREFKPFLKAFRSHCAMVMTAHVMMPALDPKFPATLSTKILRDLLRTELRYSRVVLSDDMEMKAITDHFGAEEAPRLAIEAGCDILIYRSEAATRAAYAAVLQALESGKLAPNLVLEAADRVRTLKKDTLLPYQPVQVADVGQVVGTPAHAEIVAKVASGTTN